MCINLEMILRSERRNFWAIPSGWWRATTVIAGSGAMLSLLVGLTAAASCFISDVLNSSSARFGGTLQFFSGFLIIIGVALYPLGWGNKEVQDACSDESDQSGPYYLGPCKISWSMYLLAGGVFLLFLCFGLMPCEERDISNMSVEFRDVIPGSFLVKSSRSEKTGKVHTHIPTAYSHMEKAEDDYL
ncbi:Lipoma HMGIC fusion partner [Orchesella cincta]|uniref:Lipoma HMGIC fusion partner n=1 Tax=Orchesella cincta TaxID=48709 RepID=A0A1D2NM28_ORCCI|nr:Lipoma HMGIC fusion partner [Orchesella cincta]